MIGEGEKDSRKKQGKFEFLIGEIAEKIEQGMEREKKEGEAKRKRMGEEMDEGLVLVSHLSIVWARMWLKKEPRERRRSRRECSSLFKNRVRVF